MTVAAALLVLALLDGAFAGFRSSVGRTGLISHRNSDERAARRGAALSIVLLSPVVVLICGEVLVRHGRMDAYTRAGTAMLTIYAPYALLVLAALGCYAVLNWRLKYLASALILGPFTLLRPGVALIGAIVGAIGANDKLVASAVALAVIAVLAVEPLADRRWYAQRQPS